MNIALIALSRPLSLLSPSSLSLSRIPHHQLSGLYSPLLPPHITANCRPFSPPLSLPSSFLQILAEVTNLQERVVCVCVWGGVLSICLTTTIMGRKTEIWGWGVWRGWSSRGLWDKDGGWRGRGVGVNIVMISPEFRSSGPMRRERDRERKGGGGGERESSCCPVTAGNRNCGDTSSSSSSQ